MHFPPILLCPLLSFFLLGATSLPAQLEHPFYVYGEIWDIDSRMPLPGASITAVDMADSTKVFRATIDGEGRYELLLPFDHVFRVEYAAPGYIGYFVQMDLNGVDARKRKGDHGINIPGALLRPLEEVDYTIFSRRPYGLCRLNDKGKKFVWDPAYTVSDHKEFQAVLDLHAEKVKERGF